MKLGFVFGSLVVAGFAALAPAQQRITAWDFNHTTETNHPAASIGEGAASLVGGVAGSFASGSGSSDPATAGDLAWNLAGFPGQGRNPRTAGVEFRTSTAGWRGIVIRFDLRPSNTASRTVAVQYSVDGTTFLDATPLVLTTGGAFTNGLSLDLSAVAAVDDNPNFAFRLVSAFPTETDTGYAAVNGSYSSAGTWRFDMVQVLGRTLTGAEPAIAPPPVITFTNLLSRLVRPGDATTTASTEWAVCPGERLELEAQVTSPDGTPFRIEARSPEGLSANAGWSGQTNAEPSSEPRRLRFVIQPSPTEEGRLYDVDVVAGNFGATNSITWRVYVPTAAEQGIVLTEFLANPSATVGQPLHDPFHRDPPSDKPTQHDEYVELVNFGTGTVDLGGWHLSDSAAVRHVFPADTAVGVAESLIVYGGPRSGPPVSVEGLVQPASEGISGLSLNNDGDTLILRNAASNLVWRVVYAAGAINPNGALARQPDRDGPFVPQGTGTSPAVTPGRRFDGGRFDVTDTEPSVTEWRLGAVRTADDSLELRWVAKAGEVYDVWASPVLGPDARFVPVATGLSFDDAEGRFVPAMEAEGGMRFYRVSAP